MHTLGRWIAIGVGAFVALSFLVGLFPQLFFVFYSEATALGLLGIAFLVLPASMFGGDQVKTIDDFLDTYVCHS
ncbi:MAG: hypothetical protein QGH23_09270 [Dehalococcoidia bacterium]|jgi:hypothetical protein|nr:hypothetical protein [Dehalococcoidia bacterium]MDP6783168.1 hypothetical protein [Dehalococcoidia bacterium]